MAVIEASQAGVAINNSTSIVLTVDLAIKYAAGIAGGGAILGFLLNIGLKFGDGFIKEFFRGREIGRKFKKAMADQLTAFCVEAEISDYHSVPDAKHIKRIADDIDSIDQEAGNKLRVFLNMWGKASKIAGRSKYRYHSKEASKELREVAMEWKK